MLRYTFGLTSDGAHENDPAADFHSFVSLFGNEELAAGVDVEDTVEFFRLDLGEVAKGDNTRVGAANIELAKMGNDIIHELGSFLDVANIGLERMCVSSVAQRLDLLDDGFSALDGVGIVDCDLCATLCELNSHGLANTTAYKIPRQTLMMTRSNCAYSPEPVTTATLPSKLHVCSIVAMAKC